MMHDTFSCDPSRFLVLTLLEKSFARSAEPLELRFLHSGLLPEAIERLLAFAPFSSKPGEGRASPWRVDETIKDAQLGESEGNLTSPDQGSGELERSDAEPGRTPSQPAHRQCCP